METFSNAVMLSTKPEIYRSFDERYVMRLF